jgi:hypothetical protein
MVTHMRASSTRELMQQCRDRSAPARLPPCMHGCRISFLLTLQSYSATCLSWEISDAHGSIASTWHHCMPVYSPAISLNAFTLGWRATLMPSSWVTHAGRGTSNLHRNSRLQPQM